MNIKEAKLLFQAGVLGEPVIMKARDQGWKVVLEGKHKLTPELETARGGVRVFRTVDAASFAEQGLYVSRFCRCDSLSEAVFRLLPRTLFPGICCLGGAVLWVKPRPIAPRGAIFVMAI